MTDRWSPTNLKRELVLGFRAIAKKTDEPRRQAIMAELTALSVPELGEGEDGLTHALGDASAADEKLRQGIALTPAIRVTQACFVRDLAVYAQGIPATDPTGRELAEEISRTGASEFWDESPTLPIAVLNMHDHNRDLF